MPLIFKVEEGKREEIRLAILVLFFLDQKAYNYFSLSRAAFYGENKAEKGLCLKILSNLSSIFISGKSLKRTTKFDTISDNFCPVLSSKKSNHMHRLVRIVMYGSVQSRSWQGKAYMCLEFGYAYLLIFVSLRFISFIRNCD